MPPPQSPLAAHRHQPPLVCRGHAGLDVHVVAGDPQTMVAIAKINTKGFPFGAEVGTAGRFSFPKELVLGPPRPKHSVDKE